MIYFFPAYVVSFIESVSGIYESIQIVDEHAYQPPIGGEKLCHKTAVFFSLLA